MCGARVQIGGRQKRIDKIQNKKINVKQTPHKTSKNNFKFKSSAKNLMSDKKKKLIEITQIHKFQKYARNTV